MKYLKILGKLILYGFIIVLVLALIAAGIIWGVQKYKHHQLAKELEALPIDDELSNEHMLQNYMDDTIGDNEMTVKEKIDRDLNPYQTDTSGNGLSDDEAIEQGLDPTKFSTADDGISDFVKIEEGLDPKKKIDPNEIDTYTIEDEDLGTTLKTNDLNAKYFSSIESYESSELDDLYDPVRDPLRIRDYEGEVRVDMPDGKDKNISAYYFNFAKDEMEKIKHQKWDEDDMVLTIDKAYPIYFFDDAILDDLGDYYYFRISPYIFGPGYDHKVFLFKRGFFTDDLFKDEKIDDPDYGVIEISKAEISYLYSLFLDALYRALDAIFQPLDGAEDDMYTRIWLDYGKVEGTEEYVQREVMPWLYEDEEIETENEDSKKVIDSGFRLKHNTFRFGNMLTEVGDNGICAGISRTTERIYNDVDITSKCKYETDDEKYKGLQYDISEDEDDYPFLEDGELFDYTFTDDKISHLTKDTYIDGDLIVQPDKLTEPDQSLIQLLETQWMVANDKLLSNKPMDIYDASVLDQVEDYLADGQIVLATLLSKSGGHSVSIYKMEYDRYDEDLIRLYVYDPNLPYQKMTEDYGKKEIYMEIHKKKKKFIAPDREYFDFHYQPFEDWSEYEYSNDNGYDLRLYHNDQPIDVK